MRISTLEDTANILLRMPANLNFIPISQKIDPNTTFSIRLDIISGNNTWLDSIENKPANQVLRKGLLLTSDKNVTAYYEVAHTNNPAVYSLKGKNGMGTEFYISSQNNYPNQNNNGQETFEIVATEDNTTVQITPTIDIVGHVANVPFQVVLNKGETYSARTMNITAAASLKGSHVASDKPVAVTIFDDSIITGGWDEIADQTIPVNLVGTDYIVIKGFASNTAGDNDEHVYILATDDNTEIRIDGNPTPVATLNTGQQHNYSIPTANNTVAIEATKPVYVYHLSGHTGETGAALIPQDSCTGSRRVGFNRTSSGEFAMLILCRNGIQDSFYLNGGNTVVTGASFNPVPGTANAWVYYRMNNLNTTQVPLDANLLVNTLGKFHLGILNKTGGSSEYGYFSDFSSLYLGADNSICPGDSVVLDGGNYMTTYEWKKLVGSTWTTVGSNQYFTVHDSGSYACIVNGDFCTLRDTIHMDIYEAGTVSLGPDQIICQGTSATLDAGRYQSYLWSNGSTSRWLTTNIPGTYWVRIINNNGCEAWDTLELSIDSLPINSQAIVGPGTVCQGATGVLYTIPPMQHATSYVWTLPPDATGSSTTNSISLDFSAVAVNGVLKVRGHNTCGDSPDTMLTIVLNPTPHLTNSPPKQYICSNTPTNVTLTSEVPGAAFTWSATASSPQVTGHSGNSTPTVLLNQTLINTGYTTETVTYHVTPHANGCDGPASDYIIYVYPVPDLTNTPLLKNQCNNLFTEINLTSNVLGALFTWTATGSTAQVSGFSNNTTPTALLNHNLVNSGYNIETVTYNLTPHANGCDGNPVPYLVTVFPTPDLTNQPLNQTRCNNQATGITLTSNVSGTTFTWTATGSTAQVTGFSNNAIPTTSLNQTLVNSGYNIETVTYTITPRANGCDGSNYTYTVSVNPTPDLSNTPNFMQVCNNIPTNLTLTSHVTGTLFTWTCTPSSANVTGWSNNSTPGNILNHTLVNSGLSVENVVYHILPQANACNGLVVDYTVSVVQSPDVYFNPPSQTLCSGQATNIQVLSHVPGTAFTWTATGSSPAVTGYSAGVGSLIGQTLTNTGITAGFVTYTAYPTVFGCAPGTPQSVIVNVNPRPSITNSTTTFQQCSGMTTNILPLSTIPGSAYTWSATGSSPQVTGYNTNSTPALSINNLITNTGFLTESVIYQVTPIASNCNGPAVPFTVTSYPVADVFYSPAAQTLCPWQTTNISIGSHVSGATFTWTATGSTVQVTGYGSGAGNLIQQILVNTGVNVESVTYTSSPTANGCPGTPSNVIVTVNPAPVVVFDACHDPTTFTTAQPIQLKGGVPSGGNYSGTGVSGSQFYPALAGAGTFDISYICTNQFNCRDTALQTITVIAPGPFSCGSTLTDPRDGKTYSTVDIAGKCWMSVNLNYGSTVTSSTMQRDNCIHEKYCYNDNPANCSTKGGLYQWDELMNFDDAVGAQGLCPPTWHIPTETEWSNLFNQFISNGFAGSPLKYTGYSGFNALLEGIRGGNKTWTFVDFATIFWSSSGYGPIKAWAHGMNTHNPSVSYYPASRSNAFSVRCVKD